MSLLYKRVLYCEGGTFWRYEVVNKHHTEGSGKATPPVCRYKCISTKKEEVKIVFIQSKKQNSFSSIFLPDWGKNNAES
jgi:hypothetical protein